MNSSLVSVLDLGLTGGKGRVRGGFFGVEDSLHMIPRYRTTTPIDVYTTRQLALHYRTETLAWVSRWLTIHPVSQVFRFSPSPFPLSPTPSALPRSFLLADALYLTSPYRGYTMRSCGRNAIPRGGIGRGLENIWMAVG